MKTTICNIIYSCITIFLFLAIIENHKLKQEVDVCQTVITEFNEQSEFLIDYVKSINDLKDEIIHSEYADSIINQIDSIAFDYFYIKDNNILEYNQYAFDVYKYWNYTYPNIK